MNYYQEKAGEYFTNARKDLISLLPQKTGLHILELGAGGGDTLMALKKSGIAAYAAGIELFQLPGTNQKDPLIDRFLFGNVEEMKIDLPENSFDAVLMGDVLEHLLDPWSVINKVGALVKPGGLLIASMPNIRSREGLKKIFWQGDFAYTRQGLFDKTHYRWFCKKNMIDLLTPPPFQFVSVHSNLDFKGKSGTKKFNDYTFGIFEEFLSVQFVTVSQKIG